MHVIDNFESAQQTYSNYVTWVVPAGEANMMSSCLPGRSVAQTLPQAHFSCICSHPTCFSEKEIPCQAFFPNLHGKNM